MHAKNDGDETDSPCAHKLIWDFNKNQVFKDVSAGSNASLHFKNRRPPV
jgi:hypothetical protein